MNAKFPFHMKNGDTQVFEDILKWFSCDFLFDAD